MPNGAAMPDDESLISQAQAGETGAREELFRRHFGMSYRIAYRLLNHEQDAQDAVQDGYVKAVLHLADFDGRSGFRTWLLRIVSNAALDIGRKRRRRPALRLENGALEDPGATVLDDPAQGLRREDLRQLLDAALSRLSPEKRAAFVLFAEGGLSYKEIADIQKVPVGTIMSRLHDARKKLQTWLDGVEL
jgi:RNA polymerase sigma-70 factor (ECF subfamily)